MSRGTRRADRRAPTPSVVRSCLELGDAEAQLGLVEPLLLPQLRGVVHLQRAAMSVPGCSAAMIA